MSSPAATTARERLLTAALQRFAADGALSATLDDVRRDAGVSVGALYHHFPDKAALAAALYADVLRRYHADFLAALRGTPDARGGVRAAVVHTLRWCTRHPAEARVLLGDRPRDHTELRDVNRDFFAAVRDWWAPHVHYGVLRDLEPELLSALWLGPSLEYVRHWLSGRARRSPAAVADVLADAAAASLETLEEPG